MYFNFDFIKGKTILILTAFEKSNWRFKCDFCPNTFHTEDSFNTHAIEHFEQKNCLNCNKHLLRIGSRWYELHIDDLQLDEIEQETECCYLVDVAEVKSENDVTEINDDTNSHTDDKAVFFDNPSNQSDDSDEYEAKIQRKRTRIRKAKKKNERKSKSYAELPVETGQPKRKRKLSRITCTICDRMILKYNFENHLQKMHVPNVIVSKEKKKCETCGKSFANNGNLKIHQRIHSGTKHFGIKRNCFFQILFSSKSISILIFSVQLLW